MEFSFDEWKQLIAHAETGACFLCSPFSLAAVSMLQKLGVVGWKISAVSCKFTFTRSLKKAQSAFIAQYRHD